MKEQDVTYLTLFDPDDQKFERIHTTPEHPFYVKERSDNTARPKPVGYEDLGSHWVGAGHLKIGDKIKQADGTVGVVANVTTVQQTQEMFNLTVDTAHTFYVGTNGWLVHNQTACGSTLDQLLGNALKPDRNGLTQIGRAMQKHSNRPGSVFPLPAARNPAGYNAAGQQVLEEIMTNPASKTVVWNHPRYGMVTEFRNTTFGGVRFDSKGNFMGLLDPNPKW